MSKLNLYPNGAVDFSNLIKDGVFDYIDFGCSTGGSLLFSQRTLGGKRGLGIDCKQSKVESTRIAGFDAVNFNIHDIPDNKLVRFVIMSHFLEHVPDPSDVKAFIRKACAISTDFVYIQQPYFDSDSYLARNGLKLFWSDWRGHPNRMTSLELLITLRDLRMEGIDINYSIHFRRKIKNSDDRRIHSILSPIDQHEYEIGKHPEKPQTIKFVEPVYAEIIAMITMPGIDHLKALQKIKYDSSFINEKWIIDNNNRHEKYFSKANMSDQGFFAKLNRLFKKA